MNKQLFNLITKASREYYNNLNVLDVKKEFLKDGLLNQNLKLSKGGANNYGLELVPANLISPKFSFCGNETTCVFTCLFFSGVENILKSNSINNGVLSNTIKKRIRRAFLYLNDKEFFFKLLRTEIQNQELLSELDGKKAFFRLNVLSDIDFSEFIKSMPNTKFYDYTKYWDRKSFENYHLTYSASERTNEFMIVNKLATGSNVTMVFTGKIPEVYLGFQVINGDESDNRYNDPNGVIIGLRLKTTVKANKESAFLKGGK